jgi:hypothetical protein
MPSGSEDGDIDFVKDEENLQSARSLFHEEQPWLEFNIQSHTDFRLEYEIQEDITAELDVFVRLSRLGLFGQANAVFKDSLNDHLNLFPVIAEYADSLLEQRRYRDLSNFLSQAPKSEFEDDEADYLDLLEALSNIYYAGMVCEALSKAQVWGQCYRISGEPSAVEVGTSQCF